MTKTVTETVICSTHTPTGLVEITKVHGWSVRWLKTLNGSVNDARSCWLTREEARREYDAAAIQELGMRP